MSTGKKELLINFIAIVLAFVVNALINFFLSSFIVNTVSEEAYGFTQLANTFINYFTIIKLAINSMSSRFISVEYHKNKIEEANGYYSATFWANLILVIISIPIITFLIINLENFIQISPDLVIDVKMLFTFLALNLLLGLLTTNLSVSYYIKNKLYIQSIINMFSYFIKAILLYVIYTKFSPYIAFVGLATLIATTFIQICNLYYKRKLIGNIKIGKFDFQKIKVLFVSGIWNSITRIGTVLSEGLDLLVTNLFLDPTSMGILAIVKIIPNIIGTVIGNLSTIFMPNLTKAYATEKKEELKHMIQEEMQFVGIFLNIPIICIIVLGDILFKLWFPTQDANYLLLLSIISISHWIIIGPASIIHNVFTVINKIKINSILVCVTGFLNILIVYALLKTTNLGIIAVVGVSTTLSIIRNLFYTVPFGAKYLGFNWKVFFPEIFKSLLSVIINVIIGYVIRFFFLPETWLELLLFGFLLCIISFVINCLVSFDKNKIKLFFNTLKK